MSNPLVTSVRNTGRGVRVVNNSGGEAIKISDEQRFRRFLTIGTAGGTFYASEQKITAENVAFAKSYVAANPAHAVEIAAEVSDKGLAYRNSPAILTLAIAFSLGDNVATAAAKQNFNKIVRIPTHLFEFADYIEAMSGWGRAKRSAVANWYSSKTDNNLAYAVAKYRQRNGWTHRDMWRLSHPVGINSAVGNFVLNGEIADEAPFSIKLFGQLQAAKSESEVCKIIEAAGSNVAWEFVPTEFLTSPAVWNSLFYADALNGQALIRNLTRMSKNGALAGMRMAGDVGAKLADPEMIKRTRLHPMNYFLAINSTVGDDRLYSYSGYGKPKTVNSFPDKVMAGLEDGFYASFKNIKPSGRNTLVAVDVSGSMGWYYANGVEATPSTLSAVLAMVIARSEPYAEIVGFSSGLRNLNITSKTSLDQAMKNVKNATFGGTDVSTAVRYANSNPQAGIESIVIVTDNETNSGSGSVEAELRKLRSRVNDATIAVVGMTATHFGVIDESDRRSLNVAGFSSDAPSVIADHAAGRL